MIFIFLYFVLDYPHIPSCFGSFCRSFVLKLNQLQISIFQSYTWKDTFIDLTPKYVNKWSINFVCTTVISAVLFPSFTSMLPKIYHVILHVSSVASRNLDMINRWQPKMLISDASNCCHQSGRPPEWDF